MLDPVFKVFDQAAIMLTPRFAMGAATVGGRIYVPAGVAASPGGMFDAVLTLEVFIP